jgi:superfamily II DNA or RNA helicase
MSDESSEGIFLSVPVLRKWQVQALEAWLVNFSGIAQVVTGGGKTFFAIACMDRWFKKYPSFKRYHPRANDSIDGSMAN